MRCSLTSRQATSADWPEYHRPWELPSSRLAQARVGVNVAGAVGRGPGRAAPALRGEAGLVCHATRRRVAYRVFEVEPVEAGHVEGPGRHRVDRPGSHALPPGGGAGPVGDLGGGGRELPRLSGT